MSYRGNADLIRILLEHRADVNLPNDVSYSVANKWSNYNKMLWWIQDKLGDTALIEACDGGHVDTAALLIDYGARVDYKNKVSLKNMQNIKISM